MHKGLIYAAYGWLVLTGTLHFCIDVVSQYVRGKRLPSAETTLYYGLNSAFALGQLCFGLLGVLIAWRSITLLSEWPIIGLSIAAALGWLLVTFLFMDYKEPRFNAAVYGVLIIAAALTR
jgi:hypothetical protein